MFPASYAAAGRSGIRVAGKSVGVPVRLFPGAATADNDHVPLPVPPSVTRRSAPRRVARLVAVVLTLAVAVAAAGGCAGRKGRNDDDPGPADYDVRVHLPVPVDPAHPVTP